MADVDPKVMAGVKRALKKDPSISSKDLFERIKKRHESVRDLSVRQFNARYPLQVKKALAPKRPRKKRNLKIGRGAVSKLPDTMFNELMGELAERVTSGYKKALATDRISELDAFMKRLERTVKSWR